jgi:4-amino-4-deoxy-L-arabinose transferase-like glycosyltransferase
MAPITSKREHVARAERPLLLAGLALVAAHLLDLAFSGPDTSALGVAVIAVLAATWALAQPRVTRPTRLALGVVVGLVAIGFGVISHGLHVVNSGPDWRDVTGVGYIVGGLLLVASGVAATAAPRRAPRTAAADGGPPTRLDGSPAPRSSPSSGCSRSSSPTR